MSSQSVLELTGGRRRHIRVVTCFHIIPLPLRQSCSYAVSFQRRGRDGIASVDVLNMAAVGSFRCRQTHK